MRSHFLRAVSKTSPPAFVGAVGNAAAQSQNYTINLASLSGGTDSSPSAGDLIVIVNGCTSSSTNLNSTGVVTSGFTQIGSRLDSNDTRTTSTWVSYKISDGTEASITVRGNGTGSSYGNAAVAHVWRNINQTTPLDVTTTTATGINTGRPNVPSVTPVTAGAIILGVGYGALATTAVALTAAGLSNVHTAEIGASSGGGAAIIAAYTAWTSGAYDMAQFGGGSTNNANSWGAAAVVLRPA